MRFTVDGGDALEARIARDMDEVRRRVREVLEEGEITALVLGGGYGRGEGGVYVTPEGEAIYNDYDFFVVVPYGSRARRRAVSRKLEAVKSAMEPACGVHVDFSPPMPESGLARLPYELMFMEARMGHHVVIGPADIFERMPPWDPSRPPLEECARLFMNRGIGLLLARKKLNQPGPLDQEDHEFVVRNIYKALMAMGDSVLFARADYSPSYVERRKRFLAVPPDQLPLGERLRSAYESSLNFKLRPEHSVPAGKDLDTWHREVVTDYLEVYRWFERQRLAMPAMDWDDYRALPARLPASLAERAKNVLRNLRHGRPVAGEWILHPRDRILKRLPQLLQEQGRDTGELDHALQIWQNYG